METVSKFGERLLKLREEQNETQQQLADAIGITRQSLSRYETNERTPNIDLIYSVAKHYNVSSDYLLGLTEEPIIEPDIKKACKVTGLSGEAIRKLAQLKNFILPANCGGLKVTGNEIINSLVLDQWFRAFIERLAIYYMRTRVIVYKLDNKLKFTIDEADYERALTKLALFEVGQVANLIAADFKSPHFDEAAEKIEKLKAEFEKEISENAEHNPTQE